jgi:hypothetical protein
MMMAMKSDIHLGPIKVVPASVECREQELSKFLRGKILSAPMIQAVTKRVHSLRPLMKHYTITICVLVGEHVPLDLHSQIHPVAANMDFLQGIGKIILVAKENPSNRVDQYIKTSYENQKQLKVRGPLERMRREGS